jgi:hypothetical protein
MMQGKQETVISKSLGDLAVDGLLRGLGAGLIMMAFLLGIGMVEGLAPAAVLVRFGLSDGTTAVTGLLGHLAVSAVLGLLWGVLYGRLLRRAPLPPWVSGIAYGLVLYGGATLFVVGVTGLAGFASWALLLAHGLYGLTLGLLSGWSGAVAG